MLKDKIDTVYCYLVESEKVAILEYAKIYRLELKTPSKNSHSQQFTHMTHILSLSIALKQHYTIFILQ